MLFLALLPLTRAMNMYSTNKGIFENRGKTGAPLFHRDLNRLCLKGKGRYYTWPHCPSLWQCKTTQSLWFQWGEKYPGETTLSSLWITLWEPLFWSCITAITDESVGSSQLKSYCDEESVKACNKEHVVPTCSAQVGPAALLICRTKSRLHSHQEMWQVQIYLILILRRSWSLVGLCQEMCWVIVPPTMESDFWSHLTRRGGDHSWFSSVVLEPRSEQAGYSLSEQNLYQWRLPVLDTIKGINS